MTVLTVNFNLHALVGRINRAVEEVSRHVAASLRSTNSLRFDSQRIDSAWLSIEFSSGLSWTQEEAHAAWKQWVLKNGFRDVSELLSGVLEEAHSVLSFYLLLDKQNAGVILSAADLADRDRDIDRYHRLSLADKLRWLSSQPSFSVPQERIDEINSINIARNCLSHRGGVVGPRDVTVDGRLVVSWLGMEAVIETQGREVPVDGPTLVEHGGALCLRFVRRCKEFPLGSRIAFDEQEFPAVAWTMFFFAQTVASQLEVSGRSRGIEFSQVSV